MYQPEKLKARRKELKLTQKEIAEQLGISFQAYSAWERGVKEPSKEKVKQLEEILKVRSIIYSKDLVLYCIGLGPFSLINTLRKSNSNRVNVALPYV